MWWSKKTKEEKIQDLQKEVDELNEKYKDILNSYCKIGDYIFILLGFVLENNKIRVKYKDTKCVKGYYTVTDMYWFKQRHGGIDDFDKARYNFLEYKENLTKIGLKLEKIKDYD